MDQPDPPLVHLDGAWILGSGERTGQGFEGVSCPACGELSAVAEPPWNARFHCACGAEFTLESLLCPGSEQDTLIQKRGHTLMIHGSAAAAPVDDEAATIQPRSPAKSGPADTVDTTAREDGEGGSSGVPRTQGGGPSAGGTGSVAGRDFGNYEILREVARGGMGVVYLARQKGLNREVALKMLLSGDVAGEDQVKRFMREAESAARLSHPNIVPIWDVGVAEGRHYFAMEFIRGRSAAELIAEAGAIPPRRAVRIALDTALALEHAHARGIVHRDIKPGNIMLEAGSERKQTREGITPKTVAESPGGRVMVTDFGLAKDMSGENALTLSGTALGTPAYMSPEQADGDLRNVGPASDVYSTGAVLYEMVTGREPFQANSVGQLLSAVITQDPVPPRKIVPSLHRDVETIILKAMAKTPHRRYETAAALAADLSKYLKGEAISARPAGPIQKALKFVSRHKAATISAAAALAVILAAVVLTFRESDARRARQAEKLIGTVARGFAEFAAGEDLLAERSFEDALALDPSIATVKESVIDVRMSRYLDQARSLLEAKKFEPALVVLEQASTTRPESEELSKLLRLQRGTTTLAIESDEEGLEAWFLPFVHGLCMDEKMLPALKGPVSSGEVEYLGRLPLGPMDRPFGEGWLILGREGGLEHLRFISSDRSEDLKLTIATVRVGGRDGAVPTISEALEAAPSGAEIVVEDGEYRERIEIARDCVTLRAATPMKTKIIYEGDLPAVSVRGRRGVRLEGFRIETSGSAGLSIEGSRGTALVQTSLFCPGGTAVMVSGCSDVWIIGDALLDSPALGLRCESSENVLAAGNLVMRNGEAGIFVRGGGGHFLARNVVLQNKGYGIMCRETVGLTIRENLLDTNPLGGVMIQQDRKGVRITGNFAAGATAARKSSTIPSTGIGVMHCQGTGEISRNTTLRCNVGLTVMMSRDTTCLDNLTTLNDIGAWFHEGGRIDYNCHWKNELFGQWVEKVAKDLDEMRRHYNPRNEPRMQNSFEADPLFTDADGGDYTLLPESPCRGSASDGGDVGASFEELAYLLDMKFDRQEWLSMNAAELLERQGLTALRENRLEEALQAAALGLALHPGDEALERLQEKARKAASGTGR